ncbi:MAG TPA: hypothetical protein VIV60_14000 [Polyangiaceae bacterium]
MSTSYSPSSSQPGFRWRCAYHFVKPDIRDIPRQRLIEIEMDIPTVGRATLARMHRIRATRSEMVAKLPEFDSAIVDRLELVVRAMCYVHWLCQSSYAAQELLDEWLRDISLFDPHRRWHSNQPYLNLRDLHEDRLCPYQQRCLLDFPNMSNACVLDEWLADPDAELRYCETALLDLLDELATIMPANGNDLDSAQRYFNLERQRAFTYFLTTYDHVRRAVQFVRWRAGDADDIVPSLEPALTRQRCISQVVPALRLQMQSDFHGDYGDMSLGRSNAQSRGSRNS